MKVYKCKIKSPYSAGLTIVAANSKEEAFGVLQSSDKVNFKEEYDLCNVSEILNVHYNGITPIVLASEGYVE